MNFFLLNYALSYLSTGLTLLPLAIFVYLKNPSRLVNRIFAVYSFAIAWWSLFSVPLLYSQDLPSAKMWDRLCLMGVIFVPPTFIHFTHAFLKRMDRGKYKKITWVAYGISFLFALSNTTPLFVKNLSPRKDIQFFTDPGLFYYLFLAYFALVVFYAISLLGHSLTNKTEGTMFQRQKTYLFWSTIFGYNGAS